MQVAAKAGGIPGGSPSKRARLQEAGSGSTEAETEASSEAVRLAALTPEERVLLLRRQRQRKIIRLLGLNSPDPSLFR